MKWKVLLNLNYTLDTPWLYTYLPLLSARIELKLEMLFAYISKCKQLDLLYEKITVANDRVKIIAHKVSLMRLFQVQWIQVSDNVVYAMQLTIFSRQID